ncbi:biliverdin-producing heme oxygenase [Oceanicella sp. SM1341]|uniref:biliverdin-producing heme oxygenase n=1 Tax=Oceanicella sp. SM1341 TaxID=1548889 RepID=UPI000E4FA69E|nr:biliverdin-producing heme oxygenase [Oceanicella sp. SM1341]
MRDHLRRATSGLHEAVDAGFSRYDLSRREDYADFLQDHARVLPGLEAALAASPEFARLPDAAARLRLPALRADLAALGRPMPQSLPMSYVNESGAGLGLAYVLEGSRLGARVLSRQVVAGQGSAPMAFLSHGAGERLWAGFLAWVARERWSTDEIEVATQAARSAFQAFLNVSGGCLVAQEVPDR